MLKVIKARLKEYLGTAESHSREVVVGFATAFTVKVVGLGVAFGFNVVLARNLDLDDMGLYFLALTVIVISTAFGRVGLDNAMLRHVAANAGQGDWNAVAGVYTNGMRLSIICSLFMTVVLFAFAPAIAEIIFHKPALGMPLRWMSLGIVPVSLLMLHSEVIKALKKILRSQLVQGFFVPVVSISLFLLFGREYGLMGAVIVYLCATWATACLGWLFWRNSTPQLRLARPAFSTSKLLGSSKHLFVFDILNLVMSWTPLILLGIWGSKSDLAIFGAGIRTMMLVGVFLTSVASIIAPKIASLYQQGRIREVESVLRRATLLIIILSSPVFLTMILAPGLVMGIFGPEFREGAGVLVVLTLGQLVNVFAGPVGYLLMMSGHEVVVRNITAIVTAVSVSLSFLVIPVAGIMGAAVVKSVSLVMVNLLLFGFVVRYMKINPVPFGKRKVF